jgi:protein ImuB
MFVCVHIPHFPVEALARLEPDLQQQEIAVVQGTPPLITVIAANERARAVGVDTGMTELQAEERLRHTCEANRWVVRQRSLEQESSASAALFDCVGAFSSRVERTAPDTIIAEISGSEQLLGKPEKIAADLAERCLHAGVGVNVAAAANPDTALHGARGYNGLTSIPAGKEAARLGPLPIRVLIAPHYGSFHDKKQKQSAETAAEMLGTLERWGVRTLSALAALPEVSVVERLGQSGLQWQRFARGATSRELMLAQPALDFEEVMELEYPVDLLEPLAFVLSRMLEQLCGRLQSRALATHELKIRLQLDPAVTVDRDGIPIHESRTSESESGEFLEREIKLPVPMLDSKTFLKLLQLDLQSNPPSAPVLKLWLRAEPVRPRFDQRGLFLPLTPEAQKLEITLARLTSIAGGQLNVGSPEVVDTHRPDCFRMKRFAPPAPNYERTRTVRKQSSRPTSALRRFRPPQPVSVQLVRNKPVAIGPPRALAQLEEVTRAFYGDITWCTGPWRTSGEWWNQQAWEREEWDIAVDKKDDGRWTKSVVARGSWPVKTNESRHHALLYRLYRDLLAGTWFVVGEYD